MSCEAAVFNMLSTDDALGDFGIDADRVFPAPTIDVGPRTGYYLVLRWEEKTFAIRGHGPQFLTVWCHRSRDEGTDFSGHQQILGRVVELLETATQVEGADGILTQAKCNGLGRDDTDDTFGTIVKNAAFTVLSR